MMYRIILSLLLTAFMLQAKSQIKIVDSTNATPIQDATFSWQTADIWE